VNLTRYTEILDTVFAPAREAEPVRANNVARGDSLFDDNVDVQLPSELPGVSDEAWTKFVCLAATAGTGDVSASNALGMFELSPRRLADIGLVHKLARSKKGKRTVWVGEFVPPMTSDKFLRNTQMQYRAFCLSIRDYASNMVGKPENMSLSGALAILHRAGPKGLISWENGSRFGDTQALYDKLSGVF
jgi:hypothetical protein